MSTPRAVAKPISPHAQKVNTTTSTQESKSKRMRSRTTNTVVAEAITRAKSSAEAITRAKSSAEARARAKSSAEAREREIRATAAEMRSRTTNTVVAEARTRARTSAEARTRARTSAEARAREIRATAAEMRTVQKSKKKWFSIIDADTLGIIIFEKLFKNNSSVFNSEYLKQLKSNTHLYPLIPTLKANNLDDINRYLLANITTIDLHNIVIDEQTLKFLNWTVEYSKVSTIILRNITFKNHDVATKFLEYLKKNTQIEKLILQNIKIDKNFNNFLDIIGKLTNIVWLEFSNFNIIRYFDTWKGKEPFRFQEDFEYSFLRTLIKLKKLQMLIFNNNIINASSYYYIFKNENIIKIIEYNEEYNINTIKRNHMIISNGKNERTLLFSTEGNNMDLVYVPGKNMKYIDYNLVIINNNV